MMGPVYSGFGQCRWRCKKSNVAWPWIVCGPTNHSISQRSPIPSFAAGGLSVADPAYRRGVGFLMKTRRDDGSWHVRSRSFAFQPYFESGFPHGHDQWISTAATGGRPWRCCKPSIRSPSLSRARPLNKAIVIRNAPLSHQPILSRLCDSPGSRWM